MKDDESIVFVLGAGASKFLGYPTGKELVQNIAESFSLPDYRQEDITRFKEVLKSSYLPSIDSFLEKSSNFTNEWVDYAYLGRAAIVKEIISKEDRNKLRSFDHENWYRYIWGKIYKDYRNLLETGKISFITFNYDLSLEYFLEEAIRNSHYGSTYTLEGRNTFWETMRKTNIIHVYGKLDLLPWENDKINDPSGVNKQFGIFSSSREYGENSLYPIEKLSKNISIIEDDKLPEGFQHAREMLKEASYICFLGFGYDPVNLDRLGFDEKTIYAFESKKPHSFYHKVKKIYGTAFGLKQAERDSLIKRLCPNADKRQKRLCFGNENQGIVDFLRDKFDVL
ncbi:MAG: hypothetical protein AB1454_13395 [Candidatus Auribacterota bacterium]